MIHPISPSLLDKWQQALEQALDVPSRKYEHASLFGRLVMEWLDSPNDTPFSTGGSESGDPFEHVGRKEMHDQRKEWESIVFGEHSKPDSAPLSKRISKTSSDLPQSPKS